MTFYMKPPRGNIALHILCKCVKQRFEFLSSLEDGKMTIPEDFQFLIDGTPMDRAGHFLLRLLSLSTTSFSQFFLKTETNFFVNRLSMLNYTQVTNMLKVLYKHIQETLQLTTDSSLDYCEFLLTLKHICKELLRMEKVFHTFNDIHSESCSSYVVHVPFTMCLPLVRTREVELKFGKCIVPCGKWKELLKIIFELHLEFGMRYLKTTGCFQQAMNDSRIYRLGKELERRFSSNGENVSGTNKIIRACDVSIESRYFPPCMIHLYRTLQSRHRLSHESRRQFTLFLKDAGMPIEEALIFWEKEYSQTKEGCDSGCTHSWQKDARRYRYSIRHMYGLEGGRYTYRVATCNAVQKTELTALADGGCPFQHFDTSKMKSTLSSQVLNNKNIENKIVCLKENGKPLEACHLHFTAQNNIPTYDKSHKKFSNPLQYYLCKERTKTYQNY